MLAAMSWTQWLLSVVLIGTCLFLMLVILLQRGRGGGIAAAFGGGGGSGAFGAKTGDVFTWITVVMAGVFLVLAVVANFAFDQSVIASTEAPAAAPETEPAPQLIPIQMGEDGVALPIDLENLPEGQTQGVVPIITPTPGAEGTPSDEAQPVAEPAAEPAEQPETPPAEKPAEEPSTP